MLDCRSVSLWLDEHSSPRRLPISHGSPLIIVCSWPVISREVASGEHTVVNGGS